MLTHVCLFATPWTVAHQAPLSLEISRQEYWTGLLLPPLGDLPDPEIEPLSLVSPALSGRFFTTGDMSECFLTLELEPPPLLSNPAPLSSRCGILQTTALILTTSTFYAEPLWCTIVETKKKRKKEKPISWPGGYFGPVRICFFTFKTDIII